MIYLFLSLEVALLQLYSILYPYCLVVVHIYGWVWLIFFDQFPFVHIMPTNADEDNKSSIQASKQTRKSPELTSLWWSLLRLIPVVVTT